MPFLMNVNFQKSLCGDHSETVEAHLETDELQPVAVEQQLQPELLSEAEETFYEGRRLVELNLIAKEAWCNKCNQEISLRNKVEETLHGIVSVIRLRCKRCLGIKLVHTSKATKKFHDSNLKLAVG